MSLTSHMEAYNAETRYLEQKIVIYFTETDPVEMTRDNFLISTSILEDMYSSIGSTPFGGITSNELTISLYNENGIFNPENKSSKYYGLIKKGIKIESFIKPVEEDEWDPFGVFYVTDWVTSSSGMTAEITANDKLYTIFNGPKPELTIFRDVPFAEFIITYFAYFGCTVKIDETIDVVLPYVYMSAYDNNKTFLSSLMTSVLADCFCNHKGEITILSKVAKRDKKDVFTDDNQIINISVKQSIVTNYDSAVVTCYKGQESAEGNLLSADNISLVPGLNNIGKYKLPTSPILRVTSVKATCKDAIKINSFRASDADISCIIQSTSNTTTKLDINGTALEEIIIDIGVAGNSPLSVDSKFVQRETMAQQIKEYAEAYVNTDTPTLELTIRGNPLLELGDMIEVDSNYYRIKYIGTIIKVSYEYQGHLSCVLTLANASIIKKEV